MNYKMTLAFMNDGANNNSDAHHDVSSTCLGGMMDVTIYKPLPHTGLGLTVSSWGKEIGCDVALGLMTIAEEDVVVDAEKENAHEVEGEMEEERKEVEPDAR